MSKQYRHKEDHALVIRVQHDDGTVSVCGNDPDATVFYLTREELDFNFEPVEESDQSNEPIVTAQEKKT